MLFSFLMYQGVVLEISGCLLIVFLLLPNKKVRYTITNFNEQPEIKENQRFYTNETQMRHRQTKEGLADHVFFWRETDIYICPKTCRT